MLLLVSVRCGAYLGRNDSVLILFCKYRKRCNIEIFIGVVITNKQCSRLIVLLVFMLSSNYIFELFIHFEIVALMIARNA